LAYSQGNCLSRIPNGEDWNFARLILNDSSFSEVDQIRSLLQSCRPLNPTHDYWSRLNNYRRLNGALEAIVFGRQRIVDSFRVMGGNELRDQYMQELSRIREMPMASERVRAVYQLFLRYKTRYDRNRAAGNYDGRSMFTPGETLENPALCRDYSRLLVYSLNQVQTSTSADPRRETFTSRMIHGHARPMRDGGHTWVNVRLPETGENGLIQGWYEISLDPTNITNGYSPLMPLNQNLIPSRRSEYHQTCLSIVECVQRSLRPTRPGSGAEQTTETHAIQ
jgi:hypothetical protein